MCKVLVVASVKVGVTMVVVLIIVVVVSGTEVGTVIVVCVM